MITFIVWFAVLLGVSACLAATDAAFDAMTRPAGGPEPATGLRQRSLQRLALRPGRTRLTLRTGHRFATGAAIVVAVVAASPMPGSGSFAATVVAILLIVLLAADLLPRALGRAHADGIALRTAPFVLLLCRAAVPLTLPLEAMMRAMPSAGDIPVGPQLAPGRTGDDHQHRITERASRLDDTRAWNIMTPRVDMFAWPASFTLASIAADLRTVRYSRVPVYGTRIDNVVGVLYTRDAYQALVGGQRDVTLGELAREPYFVPGSISLTRLLENFQARRIHMGIVIDEYGGTDGLVTLEDILEELVGEIIDETDDEHPAIIRVSRNEILVEGSADLREINHFFNTSFPQLEHRSLNGYLLDSFGYVPRVDEEIEQEGVRIRIVVATDQQVLRARLSRPHTGTEGP